MRESTLELAKEVLLSPLSTFKSLDLASAIFFEHHEEVEQKRIENQKIIELAKECDRFPVSERVQRLLNLILEGNKDKTIDEEIAENRKQLERIMCLNTIEDTLVNEWDKGGK